MMLRKRDRLGDIEQNKSRRLKEMPEFNVIEGEVITIEMERDFWDVRQFYHCTFGHVQRYCQRGCPLEGRPKSPSFRS